MSSRNTTNTETIDQHSLTFFRDLIENLPDMIYEVDMHGNYLYSNKRCAQITGYSKEEVIGVTYHKLVHSDDIELIKSYHKELLKSNQKRGYVEFRILTKKGKMLWVGQTSTLHYEDGELKKISAVGRDITEIVALREDLNESQELYQLVTDNSRDLITLTLMDGTFVYVSPYMKELLGFEPNELIGTNGYDLFHPEDLDRIKTEARFQNNFLNKAQYRFRRKDGEYIWVETVNRVIEGKGTRFFQASTRDISKRVEIQERLEVNNLILESIMENTTDFIYALDRDHKFLYFNSAYRDIYMSMTGVAPEIGDAFIFPPDDTEKYTSMINKVLEGERVSFQGEMHFPKGKSMMFEAMLNPVTDNHGGPIGAAAFIKDISEH